MSKHFRQAVTGKKRIIFFLPAQSITWLRHLSTTIELAKNSGIEIVVVDVSRFMFPSRESVLGKRFITEIRAILNPLRVDYVRLERTRECDKKPLDLNSLNIDSWLGTVFNSELLTSFFTFNSHKKKLEERMIQLKSSLEFGLAKKPGDLWVIPSGRPPVAKVINMVALEANIDKLFVENSWRYGGSFFSPYPTNSKSGSDKAYKKWKVEDEEGASNWLDSLSDPKSGLNSFSKDYEKESDVTTNSKFIFFTSSIDEFQGLGSDWDDHPWENQYHAFCAILRVLDPTGQDSTIRVHPNLLNKSKRQIWFELAILQEIAKKFTDLRIEGPESKANSYAMARRSLVNFVSRSTLTFELSYLQLPVVSVMPNHFTEKLGIDVLRGDATVLKKMIKSDIPSQQNRKQTAISVADFLLNRHEDWGPKTFLLDELDPIIRVGTKAFYVSRIPPEFPVSEVLRIVGRRLGGFLPDSIIPGHLRKKAANLVSN